MIRDIGIADDQNKIFKKAQRKLIGIEDTNDEQPPKTKSKSYKLGQAGGKPQVVEGEKKKSPESDSESPENTDVEDTLFLIKQKGQHKKSEK